MSKRSLRRLFWPLFLSLAVGGGYYFWQQKPPQRVKALLSRLEHPNARVASEAWRKLNNLYYTEWTAFYLLFDEMQKSDSNPISFLIEKQRRVVNNVEQLRQSFSVNDRVIFYNTELVHCRTVGEALFAIAYNDPKIPNSDTSDWPAWWQRHKAAIQSGR